ncbi:MAG: hypothetical protein ACUVSL_00265, partial [Chloroflexus sp.]|uniref:hypothetical protein n=1 Tax=Chloroflexus sp. TaxID=1904827 RepID=UPI004049E6F3
WKPSLHCPPQRRRQQPQPHQWQWWRPLLRRPTGALDGVTIFARFNPPCLTYHQLGEKGSTFGPCSNLDELKDMTATRVEGLSAEEYVHQSIVEPATFVVKQCPTRP